MTAPGADRVLLQYTQPLADPDSEHGNEPDSPQDGDDSQIPAYDSNFVSDLVLFSSKMSFSIIEDDVILFLHVENTAIEEHRNRRGSQHSLENDQTHKGSVHVEPPKNGNARCSICDFSAILKHFWRFGADSVAVYWTETLKRYWPELKTNPPVSALV